MEYVVVRVTAPTEEVVSSHATEEAAVDQARTLVATAATYGTYYELREDGGRTLWTSETGDLERL